MLLVKIINVGGSEDACMYDAAVFVNTREIWKGRIGPHNRAHGWECLVSLLACTADEQSITEKDKMERGLNKDGDGCVCPVCKSPVTVRNKNA